MESLSSKLSRFFRPRPYIDTGIWKRLHESLHDLYQDDCCRHLHDLNEDELLFTNDELDAFITKVWKNKFQDGSIDVKRTSKYAAKFMEGVTEGFGKSLSEVDYNTPDYNMLASLAKDVFHFSSAKNRAEIMALSSAMRDETGKVRSFASFKKEAAAITGEFQGNWLKAEYDLAINASTMAARWVDYSSSTNAILEYRTAGDLRVRPAHAALNGIRREVIDSFWDTYYPPNGWNCRCHVIKTTVGRTISQEQLPPNAIDDVPPMFRSNFAKEGLVFPPGHPYNKLPVMVNNVAKAQANEIRNWAAENLVGITVNHKDLGEISFTNQGIKEALNQPHSDYNDKNLAIYRIKEIVANSLLVKTVDDAKGRLFIWHYLETEIINKQSFVVIKEQIQTGKKSFYSIVDKIK